MQGEGDVEGSRGDNHTEDRIRGWWCGVCHAVANGPRAPQAGSRTEVKQVDQTFPHCAARRASWSWLRHCARSLRKGPATAVGNIDCHETRPRALSCLLGHQGKWAQRKSPCSMPPGSQCTPALPSATIDSDFSLPPEAKPNAVYWATSRGDSSIAISAFPSGGVVQSSRRTACAFRDRKEVDTVREGLIPLRDCQTQTFVIADGAWEFPEDALFSRRRRSTELRVRLSRSHTIFSHTYRTR
jgi:hypothetical protein